MKRVSLIAAGLLAFGIGAARADETTVEVIPPNAAAPAPVPAGVPAVPAGTATTPSGAAVGVNPPAPVVVVPVVPPPVNVPPRPQMINNNVAATNGASMEPAPLPVRPAENAAPDHGTMHDTEHTWVGRLGSGFLVGGGYEDFTGKAMRNQTGGGGTWNARAVVGTRQFVGVEGAYVGSAHSVDALGVNSSAVLVSNGLEGNVRVNLPITMQRAQLLEPFGFVGLGWQHYQVTNTTVNTSDLARNDDVMTVPLGGGIAYAIGRFMADARFTYRPTYYSEMLRQGGSLSNWGVGGQVGVAF